MEDWRLAVSFTLSFYYFSFVVVSCLLAFLAESVQPYKRLEESLGGGVCTAEVTHGASQLTSGA